MSVGACVRAIVQALLLLLLLLCVCVCVCVRERERERQRQRQRQRDRVCCCCCCSCLCFVVLCVFVVVVAGAGAVVLVLLFSVCVCVGGGGVHIKVQDKLQREIGSACIPPSLRRWSGLLHSGDKGMDSATLWVTKTQLQTRRNCLRLPSLRRQTNIFLLQQLPQKKAGNSVYLANMTSTFSNPRPFEHESGALTTELPALYHPDVADL